MKRLTASELRNHQTGYFWWIDDETHYIKVIVFDNGVREDYNCATKEGFKEFIKKLDER